MSYWKKFNDLGARVLDWLVVDDKSTVDVNEVYEDEKPPVVRNKRTKTKGKSSQKPKSKKGRGRPKGSKKKKTKIAQKSWPR
jgi:hypothetical protein